jgi:CRISPR/Cas system-associated exonuclease Cas4 (RecB family)
MDTLMIRGWHAFFKNERRSLEDVTDICGLKGAYELNMDLSIATAMSKTSKLLGDADPLDIAKWVRENLSELMEFRMERTRRHMQHYGIGGYELGHVVYPPEDVERRIVDFKHRISGKISLLRREMGQVMPIQFSNDLPSYEMVGRGSEMIAKINALLAREYTQKDVTISCIYYIKVHRMVHIQVPASNKEDIKVFADVVKGAQNYRMNEKACERCEYREVCRRT